MITNDYTRLLQSAVQVVLVIYGVRSSPAALGKLIRVCGWLFRVCVFLPQGRTGSLGCSRAQKAMAQRGTAQ